MADINIGTSKKPTINISNSKTNDDMQIMSTGTRNHNKLYNLDYDSSGHMGFQKELTFDETPTADSYNPVTSKGIKTALDLKADKADTLAGYGITDAYTKDEMNNALNPIDSELEYLLQNKANKSTTLSGYGIEDAYTKSEIDDKVSKKVDKEEGKGLSKISDISIENITEIVGETILQRPNPDKIKITLTNQSGIILTSTFNKYSDSDYSKLYNLLDVSNSYVTLTAGNPSVAWINSISTDSLVAVNVMLTGSYVLYTNTEVDHETGVIVSEETILYEFYDYSSKTAYTITEADIGRKWFMYREGTKLWLIRSLESLAEYLSDEITKKADDGALRKLQYYGDSSIEITDTQYFTHTDNGDGTYTITGLTDTGKINIGTEVVIPYEINGKKITTLFSGSDGIGSAPVSILDGNSTITKVVIPKSVTTLGAGAFYYCNNLIDVNIPDSITSIGHYAFNGCTSLTSINIPNSVTSIGIHAFSSCTSLTSINIPNSVTSIGIHAFSSCTSLTSINIPNSVTSIGDYAFNGCTNLTIYCEQGSYADTYATENGIPVKYDVIEPDSYANKATTLAGYGITDAYTKAEADVELERIEAVAKGRATGYVFDTVDDMNTWLADAENTAQLVLGDNLYIRALDVPDYWWDGAQAQQLETQKVDLSEYVKTTELAAKADKTTFVKSEDTSALVTMLSNTETRLGTVTQLEIILPETIPEDYISSVVFTSGETGAVFIQPMYLYLSGEGCADGVFTPAVNMRYTVILSYDGVSVSGIVGGVPLT